VASRRNRPSSALGVVAAEDRNHQRERRAHAYYSAELEAKVATLEAERAGYRAVVAAVNGLGQNQREHTEQLRHLVDTHRELADEVRQLADGQTDTSARVRSMEQNLAEARGLLIRVLVDPNSRGLHASIVAISIMRARPSP
jgi:glutamate/tyrosine decarboxylase-like PLP-dependent enzyme